MGDKWFALVEEGGENMERIRRGVGGAGKGMLVLPHVLYIPSTLCQKNSTQPNVDGTDGKKFILLQNFALRQ